MALSDDTERLMKSYAALSGETRVVPIIGDLIAQVKSPADVTEALLERGHNRVVVPIHVTPSDVHDCRSWNRPGTCRLAPGACDVWVKPSRNEKEVTK
jgi:hypothetical protein